MNSLVVHIGNNRPCKIAVVGGGASGLAAAVELVRLFENAQAKPHDAPSLKIHIFEASKRIGTSILRSGNGRCNFSHENITAQVYHNSSFVSQVFSSNVSALRWFAELGLVWNKTSEGLLYPYSNKASSVLDVLRAALEHPCVSVSTQTRITAIKRVSSHASRANHVSQAKHERHLRYAEGKIAQGLYEQENQCDSNFDNSFDCFELSSDTRTWMADVVILACGSQASSLSLETERSIIAMPLRPVLGALATQQKPASQLNGVRVRARVLLPQRNFSEQGEVLFRDYGLSGIVVFNASRYAQPGDVLLLDVAPDFTHDELKQNLEQRFYMLNPCSAAGFMRGFLLPAVAKLVLQQAGIQEDSVLNANQIPQITTALKGVSTRVKGIANKQACQVCRGGYAVSEVNPCTMEVQSVPRLYLTGEALDVDGPCGGYNLHWAWTTGIVAARSIVARLV